MKRYKIWRRNAKIMREKPEIWLLEKEKIGYIQIPKVATRSIQACLAQYYADTNSEIGGVVSSSKEDIRRIEAKTAYHLSQKKMAGIASEYFIFGFVRNPYDRLYSAYKNKVLQPLEGGGKNIFENHGVDLGISFNAFIEIVTSISDERIDRHLRSQSWFLSYKNNLIPSYIGHLESFDKDWAGLCEEYGLGTPSRKNSTNNLMVESYFAQYDRDMEEKVFRRYQKDFEMFGYKRLLHS